MANEAVPPTKEMVEGFKRVQAGTGTLAEVMRTCGFSQSSISRKYKKWLATADGAAPLVNPKAVRQAAQTGLEGFSLKGVRTASKKPQNSTRALLYTLEEGRGYAVEDLCREWNVQPDTLTKHAKSVGAFVYAEVSRENWIPAITYPKR